MISTNWSTPESPGNIGWPRSNSANTQPALHTSKNGKLLKFYSSIVSLKRLTNFRRVIDCTKNQFRCSIIARANVWNIWFALQQLFCATKVTSTKIIPLIKNIFTITAHTVSAQPYQDPKGGFEALCRDGKCPTSGYKRDFETIGTCRAVCSWVEQKKVNQKNLNINWKLWGLNSLW